MYRLLYTAILFVSTTVPSWGQPSADSPSDHIRRIIEIRIHAEGLQVDGRPVYANKYLPEVYRDRNYRPAWSSDGSLSRYQSLIDVIGRSVDHGLEPDDYHRQDLLKLVDEARKEETTPSKSLRLARLDILATDAFLLYASHLLSGRVDPASFDPQWHARRRPDRVLEAFKSVESDLPVGDIIETLLPTHAGYRQLMSALSVYRSVLARGGFQYVSDGAALHPGDISERVIQLRTRLWQSADLDSLKAVSGSDAGAHYDSSLEIGVRHFQRRHGLNDDGVVGQATLAALNTPIEERVQQIILNLERWRWLSEDLGRRYILVNIAAFQLSVFDGEEEVMAKRVIVGRPYRRTPVFSEKMTYIVFSPMWHVPRRLAVHDKLPLIKKDPGYLSAQGIRVFPAGRNSPEIDPATIDWNGLTPSTFPYSLRQDPGPLNALGKVKFMFPNEFNVYLHDTPSRELFSQTERAFSSGCIRVQEPLDLAEYLLAGDPAWTRDRIDQAASAKRETTVFLSEQVLVHLQYWTAFVDGEGILNFRKDIYERDVLLADAMKRPPPS